MSDELEKLRAELASARAKEEKAVSAYCVELSMRGTAEAERDALRAELAKKPKFIGPSEYIEELAKAFKERGTLREALVFARKYTLSQPAIKAIDAALANGGGDE